MRVFLMLLIFAIGFGGYAAAANAFAGEACHAAAMVQPLADADMPCHGHKADEQEPAGDPDTAQNENSGAGQCLSCTHCCVSHAANMPEFSFDFVLPSGKLSPPAIGAYAGDFLFPLLRPPQILV